MKLLLSSIFSFLFLTVNSQKIIFEGDSNTRGEFIESPGFWTGSIENYPNQTMTQLNNPALTGINIGINSAQSNGILLDMKFRYPSIINSNSVFVLMIGINDFGNLSTASSVFSNVKEIMTYVRSLQCNKIVVGTYPPTDRQPVGGSGNSNRLIYNQIVRDSATFYNYVVADVASAPQFAAFDQPYYADNIHWNILGCSIVASKFKTAIEAALAPSNTGFTPFSIVPKQNTVVYWNQNGKSTIQSTDVIQSFGGTKPVDQSTITISPNSFDYFNTNNSQSYSQAYTTNKTTGNQDWIGELGMDFKVLSAGGIQINQLGAFDHAADGIKGTQGPNSNSIRVAIFNKSTQTIIPGLDVLITGSSDDLVGNFRMRTINPVTLPAGEYILVTKGYNANELNGNHNSANISAYGMDNGNGALQFVESLYGNNNISGFNYPAFVYTKSAHAFLSGTFSFALASNNNSGGSSPTKTINISAKDIQGNIATATTTITITDTTRPEINSKNVTITLDASGSASIAPSDVIQSISDNTALDSSSIVISNSTFNCSDLISTSNNTSNTNSNASHQAYMANTNNGNQNWKGELGMEFSVNNVKGIVIKQLGAFDDKGNGITGTQGVENGVRVAIFNKLTKTIVPGLDVIISGFADDYVGKHRIKNISPVTLAPGNYVIVAKGYNDNEANGNRNLGGFSTNLDNAGGAISFVQSSYSDDNPVGFGYPQYDYANSSNAWIAGTMIFELPTTNNNVTSTNKTVTITAKDIFGNTATTTAIITINSGSNCGNVTPSPCDTDTIAPVIIVKNITIALSANGSANITPNDVITSVTDNCTTVPTLQLSQTTFSCSDLPATTSTSTHMAYSSTFKNGNQKWEGELGMVFKVNNTNGILINELGAFDDKGDGIFGTQGVENGIRVAIFNKATKTIIPNLDIIIAGNAGNYKGNHRMVQITPVILPPGEYVIVAKGYNSLESNGNRNNKNFSSQLDDLNGAVSFIESSYGDNNPTGFSYPAYSYNVSPNAWIAGTFSFGIPIQSTNNNVVVNITATDAKGNTSFATANVLVTDPGNYCNTALISKTQLPNLLQLDGFNSMQNNLVKVFPNPSNGIFTVQLNVTKNLNTTIQIIDINGRMIEQKIINGSDNNAINNVPFNLSSKANGLYIIKIIGENGITTSKFIKQ